jgi:hypothetical protein
MFRDLGPPAQHLVLGLPHSLYSHLRCCSCSCCFLAPGLASAALRTSNACCSVTTDLTTCFRSQLQLFVPWEPLVAPTLSSCLFKVFRPQRTGSHFLSIIALFWQSVVSPSAPVHTALLRDQPSQTQIVHHILHLLHTVLQPIAPSPQHIVLQVQQLKPCMYIFHKS